MIRPEQGSISGNRVGLAVPEKALVLTAWSLLLLPAFCFLTGFLRPAAAVPMTGLLLAGVFFLLRNVKVTGEFRIGTGTFLCILAVSAAFALLAGQGGFFLQKMDHQWRNAILHDLIFGEWPVTYETFFHGKLVYYFGYFLPPALIGKLLLWAGCSPAEVLNGGHTAMLCWTTLNLTVIVLLLVSLFRKTGMCAVLLILGVFCFFNTMDWLGYFIFRNRAASDELHTSHWFCLMYAGNFDHLAWAFNQAVPAWLTTALVLKEKDCSRYGALASCCFWCAPFPLLGIAGIMGGLGIGTMVRKIRSHEISSFFREIFSPENLLFFFSIVPAASLFFLSNATVQAGSGTGDSPFMFLLPGFFPRYFVFILLTSLILAALLLKERHDLLMWLVLGELLLIPLYRVVAGDFFIRATLPALFILMTFAVNFLLNGKKRSVRYILVCIVLLLGSVSTLVSMLPAVRKPFSPECRLDGIGSFAERYPKLLVAKDGPEGQNNFICTNWKDTFFFRYLAGTEAEPLTTENDKILDRIFHGDFADLRGRVLFAGKESGVILFRWSEWIHAVIPAEQAKDTALILPEYVFREKSPSPDAVVRAFSGPKIRLDFADSSAQWKKASLFLPRFQSKGRCLLILRRQGANWKIEGLADCFQPVPEPSGSVPYWSSLTSSCKDAPPAVY